MAGPENTFIASVHKFLPSEDALHREKNHNIYRGGTADVWYSGRSDLWIEYKFITIPRKDDTVIDLCVPSGKKDAIISSLQQQWLWRRWAEGRNIAVIVGCKEGGMLFAGTSWIKPRSAIDYRHLVRSRQEIAEWIVSEVGVVKHDDKFRSIVLDRTRGNRRVSNSKRRAAADLHVAPVGAQTRTIRNAKRK